MSPITPPVATTTPPTAPAPTQDREQLKAAAKQFEAIFVRQMLSEARKAHFGGDELFGSQGMDTFRQMQDERFADIASDRGAFGIAKMLELQLAKQLPPETQAQPEIPAGKAQ